MFHIKSKRLSLKVLTLLIVILLLKESPDSNVSATASSWVAGDPSCEDGGDTEQTIMPLSEENLKKFRTKPEGNYDPPLQPDPLILNPIQQICKLT
jgi:hypothetical protein